MTNETGGPAFPVTQGCGSDTGMTMRDYFAAKAMQGLLAADMDWTMQSSVIAKQAYDQADSDRMACKLRMSTEIFYSHVFVSREAFQHYCSGSISHNNTDEDVYRAVREARLLVAVEIGKGMV
jgi:hypothetical protein